jgi:hypothetical protein
MREEDRVDADGSKGEGATDQELPEPPEADEVANAARLVVGAASLGVDVVSSWLRAWNREPSMSATDPAPQDANEAGEVVDAMMGVAVRGTRSALSLGARGAELARRGLRSAEGATKAVGRFMPEFMAEPMEQARDEAGRRMRRLRTAGRAELDRSRAIARAALEDGLDAVFARVADSRELQFVIRTQSVTAAEEAVDGIREQAARIDDRLEGAARKLLRRRAKPPATALR